MASTPKTKTPKKRSSSPKRLLAKTGDLVVVTWMDACADIGWEDHREAKTKAAKCLSVGWVGASKEPQNFIILYADKAHDDTDHDSNRRLAIPMGWITSIRKLKA